MKKDTIRASPVRSLVFNMFQKPKDLKLLVKCVSKGEVLDLSKPLLTLNLKKFHLSALR